MTATARKPLMSQQEARDRINEIYENLATPPDRSENPEMVKKYVVLHQGVGMLPRGTVFTPPELYGENVHVPKQAKTEILRLARLAGLEIRGEELLLLAREYVSDEVIFGEMQRLLRLKAVRPATPFEATQKWVQLSDETPSALASEEKVAQLNARIKQLEAELQARAGHDIAGAARAAAAAATSGIPHDVPGLIAEKDTQVATMRAMLAAAGELPPASAEMPAAPPKTGSAPENDPMAPGPAPGSRLAPRKGPNTRV